MTAPTAAVPAAKVRAVALDRVDDRIVEEVDAAVDGKHLPLPVLLDRRRGPSAIDVEAASVGELVALLGAAARDRERAGIDLRGSSASASIWMRAMRRNLRVKRPSNQALSLPVSLKLSCVITVARNGLCRSASMPRDCAC